MTFPENSFLYAHLYRARGGGFELFFSASVASLDLTGGVRVAGKREARKLAAERGAVCWNF